ncbi:MAG: hypothetical protein EOO94_04910, partial [Pedobacter sp.]
MRNTGFPFQILFLLILGFSFGQICHAQTGGRVPDNQLHYDRGAYHLKFKWLADSSNGFLEPQAALLLPVSFDGCKEVFYMQFDLGSPFTLMYSNKLVAIRSAYPDLLPATDTNGLMTAFRIRVGSVPVIIDTITSRPYQENKVAKSSTKASGKIFSPNIIGTIGSDFIDNRVLTIDYSNSVISIDDEVSSQQLAANKFEKFIYANRSILLPVKINGRETVLFFDTGSSAFELLTDKATATSLSTPGRQTRKSALRSWDRILTAYTTESDAEILMAEAT